MEEPTRILDGIWAINRRLKGEAEDYNSKNMVYSGTNLSTS
jgi:hypothetical protein